jgi:hypothetical protein
LTNIFCIVVVALTGYETVTTLVDDFNTTQRFWYDPFLPGRGPQPGTLCDPHELNVGDSFITNSSLFEWKLVTIGTNPKNTTRNIVYKGSTLESCDINAIYMTADLRTRTTDTIAVITCQDVDGFEFLAKTSYQMTFLAGSYAPPLLEAIPKPYGLGNTGKPESVVLNTMLVLSTYWWHSVQRFKFSSG